MYSVWKGTLLLACLAGVGACPFAGYGSNEEVTNPHLDSEFDDGEGNLRRELQAIAPFVGTHEEAIANAKADILDLIDDDRDLGPKFVRLGFHDCAGVEGCNGCVNLDQQDHAGLRRPMRALRDTCRLYRDHLTRADCWALAALTAAEASQPDNRDALEYPFVHYGRATCDGANGIGNGGPIDEMPSPHFTTEQVLDYFDRMFDFNADETVAIMGAHNLGRLNNDNSGFDGPWVRSRFSLTNEFYRLLIDRDDRTLATPNYRSRNNGNDNDQFLWLRRSRDRRRRRIMLNADMSLVSDFSGHIDVNTGEVATCVIRSDVRNGGLPECPRASATFDKVSQFSRDNRSFLREFRNALTKMMLNEQDLSVCDGQTGPLCDLSA